jgi:Holliday junction DNA helicase RuvA
MFEYLRGDLRARHPTRCVVDVGGVAYRVSIPLSTYRALPSEGVVQVWIYTRFSEEQLELFGFVSEEERDLFATMVDTVPSLGPRRALGILSSMTAKELLECVHLGEIGRLRGTKGIGDKLASRLILELRGKLPEKLEGGGSPVSSVFSEAVLALVSLGYARKEAEDAVAKARRQIGGEGRLEDLIKRSLEHV